MQLRDLCASQIHNIYLLFKVTAQGGGTLAPHPTLQSCFHIYKPPVEDFVAQL